MKSKGRFLLLSVLVGAALGAAWWAAYTPSAHPLGLLVAGYAAAGGALGGALWGARQRGAAGLVLALVAGGGAAPAWLAPLHDAGMLGGAVGLGVDLAVVGLCAALGVVAGRLLSAAGVGKKVAGGALVVGAGAAMVVSGGRVAAEVAVVDQPRAVAAGGGFPTQKVAVLGLDGADWRVLDPLLASGQLPNLAALIAAGQRGVLWSIEPTYSPVVWTTIFTGQPPEVHGLVDWYRSDARSRRVPTLWDIFGAHGRSSVTVNVPGTWPPADVAGGVMLAGFPIPGLTTGARGQLIGQVVSTEDEAGEVVTRRAEARSDGSFAVDVPLAAPEVKPAVGLRNHFLDLAVRKQWIELRGHRLQLSVTRDGDRVVLSGPGLEAPASAREGAWSDWMHVRDGDLDAVVRAYVWEARDGRLRMFLTPAYQWPSAPRYPFATGLEDAAAFFDAGEPYVVEGLGWTAHRDPRVAPLVPSALAAVEELHAAATERLLARGAPDLLSYVITITDRLQHPFWPLHEPEAYPDLDVPEGLVGVDPVVDAIRQADEIVGRIIARLPADTLVFIASDHGFQADVEGHEGGHRLDGIWIAAGPGVPASDAPLDMAVADLVPTILRCVGAPVADDFAGRAAAGVCPDAPTLPTVPTYRDLGQATHGPALIDEDREEQLRSMGYIE